MARVIELGIPRYVLTLTGGSGTWTLSYDGLTTTPANSYTETAANVQTRLRALASVGPSSTVTGANGGPYTITIITPVELGALTATGIGSAVPTLSSGYTLIGITDFVPVGIGDAPNGFPLTVVETTDGAQPDITFSILTEWMRGGSLQQFTAVVPGGLQSGQTVMDRDGTTVYFAGRIGVIEADPSGPANIQYQVTATSYLSDLYKPVEYLSFGTGVIVYNGQTFDLSRDTHRVMYLLAVHLPDWYHDSTFIPDAAYATFSGVTGYYKTNVYNILKDIAAWAGTDLATPVATRSWRVSADSTGHKYLSYFSRVSGSGNAPISITSVAASAQRAKFWDAKRISDPTRIINGIVIAGPGGEPETVGYTALANVTVRDDLLIKTAGVDGLWNAGAFGAEGITSEGGYLEATMQREVRVWLPSHSYAVGDYVMGTGTAEFIVYKCTVAGTSGAGAPTWVLVADGSFTEAASTLTWKCHRWKASRAYAVGEYVVRTTSTGQLFKCTVAGTSGASQPAWNVTENGTTPDGGVTWTTRTHSAIAMGFSTTNSDANWNTILFGVTATYGRIDVIYNGTVLSAAVATHGVGARIKVDIVRATSRGAPYWAGQVWRDNGTGYELVEAVAFTYAQVDDGTHGGANRFPMYPDFSIYYLGNSLGAANIRRHAYSTFQRTDSVGVYDEHWAAEVLKDDTLDTVEKRQRKAEQIFDRRAYPRVTFTCTTDGLAPAARYQLSAGQLLSVYEPKFSWNPQQLMIARVTTDWETEYVGGGNFGPPLQHLELGDRLLEDGEDDDLGWLVRIREEDVGSPPFPPELTLQGNSFDPYSDKTALTFEFTPSPSPNIIDQRLYLTVNGVQTMYAIGLATRVGLLVEPSATFSAFATALQSLNSVITESAPSATIEDTAAPATNPDPPALTMVANADGTYGRYDPATEQVVLEVTVVLSPSPNIVNQHLYVSLFGGPPSVHPIGLATSVLFSVAPSTPFSLQATATNTWGRTSALSTPADTGVAMGWPLPISDINGSFEEYFGQQFDVPLRWVRTFDSGGGTSSCVRDYTANFAHDGLACLRLGKTGAGSPNPSALSYFIGVQGGEDYLFKLWRRASTLGPVGLLEVLWYDNSLTPALVQTDVVPLDPAPVGGWSYFQYSYIAPPTATIARLRFTNDWLGGASNLWFDGIKFDLKTESVELVREMSDKLYNGNFSKAGQIVTLPDGWAISAVNATCVLDASTKVLSGINDLKMVLAPGATSIVTAISDYVACQSPITPAMTLLMQQMGAAMCSITNTGALTGKYWSVSILFYNKSDTLTGEVFIRTDTVLVLADLQNVIRKEKRTIIPTDSVKCKLKLTARTDLTSASGTTFTIYFNNCLLEPALGSSQIGVLNTSAVEGTPITTATEEGELTSVQQTDAGLTAYTALDLSENVIGGLYGFDNGVDPKVIELLALLDAILNISSANNLNITALAALAMTAQNAANLTSIAGDINLSATGGKIAVAVGTKILSPVVDSLGNVVTDSTGGVVYVYDELLV